MTFTPLAPAPADRQPGQTSVTGDNNANASAIGAINDHLVATTTRRTTVAPEDTLADIQAAIDSSSVVEFLPGTYTLSGTLTPHDDLELRLAPGAVIDASGLLAGTPLLEAAGVTSDAIALSADASVGTNTLSMSSSAAFAPGDLVLVRSERQPHSGQPKDGELHFVDSTATGQITIEDRLWASYATVDTATVEKVAPVRNVTVRGGKIIGSGADGAIGVRLQYCLGVRFVGVTFEHFRERAIHTRSVVGMSVTDCRFYWSNQAGLGYGIIAGDATQWLSVVGCFFVDCRHGVVGGGGSTAYGRPRFVTVSACQFYGGTDAGVDGHSPCQFWTITGNTISLDGASMDGIVWQGSEVVVEGNVVTGPGRHAIVLQPLRPSEEIKGATVRGNVLDRVGDIGVLVSITAGSAVLSGLVIEGNTVIAAGGTGMYLLVNASGAAIREFTVANNTIARSGSRGLWLRASVGTVEWGTVAGNRVNVSAAVEALYLFAATGYVMQRVAVTGNAANGGSYGIRGAGHSNCFVDGNIALGSSGGLLGFATAELGSNMTA